MRAMYAGCDVDEKVKLFHIMDGKSEPVRLEDWRIVLKEMSAAPGEMLEVNLLPPQDEYDATFEVPDEEREGVPPNADGSVHVGQLDLFCAIMAHLAKRHPGLTCQSRQMNAIKDAADAIVEVFARPIIKASPNMGLYQWLTSDDTGLSSMHMARVLAECCGQNHGVPGPAMYEDPFAAPSDPSDLGRCLRLLEAVPQLVPHLGEMSKRSPLWAAYIAKWPEMVALYKEEYPTGSAPKLYDLMHSIQDEVRKACVPPAAIPSSE